MVLLHCDFGTSNIMVDGTSYRLTGVIDWAEAEICPFGQNLHSLQALTGALHLKNGWRRYEGYEALKDTFWSTFQDEVGDLSVETMKIIKIARIMGLLRSRGFTKRLPNMPPATPIRDDETGRYNMLSLDGFLVNQTTRFDDLN
jgi:Ser/Thr protein kinase RdoA (MazF antagonist)